MNRVRDNVNRDDWGDWWESYKCNLKFVEGVWKYIEIIY